MFQKRLLFSLAYVPPTSMERYAKIVAHHLKNEELLRTVLKSHMATWIGCSERNQAPRFRHEWMSVYGREAASSYSEADNSRLTKMMGLRRPGMWRFLLRLASVYNTYEAGYTEWRGGRRPRRNKKDDNRRNQIRRVVARFDEMTANEYLLRIVKATSV
jgi:hypothetical protein